LYILDSPATAGQVFAFNLDQTPGATNGAITTQIGTAQATGQSPIGMAIDPTGALWPSTTISTPPSRSTRSHINWRSDSRYAAYWCRLTLHPSSWCFTPPPRVSNLER